MQRIQQEASGVIVILRDAIPAQDLVQRLNKLQKSLNLMAILRTISLPHQPN